MSKYTYDIKVYAVKAREEMIKKEYIDTGVCTEDDIVYDDRPNGGACIYNNLRAWEMPCETTHRLCMADDLHLCENFREYIQKIIDAHPDDVITLYNACYDWYKYDLYPAKESPYYLNKQFCANATIMPIKYVPIYKQWLLDKFGDNWVNMIDDEQLYNWCFTTNHRNLCTIPTLIQHIGNQSILTPDAGIRYTCAFKEKAKDLDKINWASQVVYPRIMDKSDPITQFWKSIKAQQK